MPMLVLGGEKASGDFLIEQGKLVDSNVRGVIVPGAGHWLMEEAPEKVIPELVAFLNGKTAAIPGTSGASGMAAEVLKGGRPRSEG